ncbi:hypothetical protein HY604_01000 [Candidatus Peregrinibacteria bacterium]|nr:hypothetical protein [Candidatus Peregrinibacteria bacterium]
MDIVADQNAKLRGVTDADEDVDVLGEIDFSGDFEGQNGVVYDKFSPFFDALLGEGGKLGNDMMLNVAGVEYNVEFFHDDTMINVFVTSTAGGAFYCGFYFDPIDTGKITIDRWLSVDEEQGVSSATDAEISALSWCNLLLLYRYLRACFSKR